MLGVADGLSGGGIRINFCIFQLEVIGDFEKRSCSGVIKVKARLQSVLKIMGGENWSQNIRLRVSI